MGQVVGIRGFKVSSVCTLGTENPPPQSWYKSYGFRALGLRATETLRSKVSINCRLGSRGTRRC